MGRLEGKVALISGGARGQGAAEARMFALEGAKVVLGDVLDDEGKKVEAQIRELGGEATYVPLDVTKGRMPSSLEMARDSSSKDMAFSRSPGSLRWSRVSA